MKTQLANILSGNKIGHILTRKNCFIIYKKIDGKIHLIFYDFVYYHLSLYKMALQFSMTILGPRSKPKTLQAHNEELIKFLLLPGNFSAVWGKIQTANPNGLLDLKSLYDNGDSDEDNLKLTVTLLVFKKMTELKLPAAASQTTSSQNPMLELDQVLQKLNETHRVCMDVRRILLVQNDEQARSAIQEAVSKLLGM